MKIKEHLRKLRHFFSDQKYNFKDRLRQNLVIIFGLFIATGIGIISYSSLTPRPSNVQSTPLNEAQSFGTLGKSVKLTSRKYNPNTGIMLLAFKFTDNTNSDVPVIDTRKIDVGLGGDNYYVDGQTMAKVIPTSPDTLDVQFKGIKSSFRAIKVNFKDKSINTEQIAQATASGDSTSEKTKEDSPKAEFVINNDKLKVDHNLMFASQEELALEQNTQDILDEQTKIKKNREAIRKIKRGIKEQKNNIEIARKQMETADQNSITNLQTSIDEYKSKIQSARDLIQTTNGNIQSEHDRIISLQEYRQKIIENRADLQKAY